MNIIFDLDGTLALIEHRRHFVSGPTKDWPAFFRACVDDKPNQPIIDLCWQLLQAGAAVQIWSGRSDEVRQQTEIWLNDYHLFMGRFNRVTPLRMRPAGDHRSDVELKQGWLLESIAAGWRPDIVFDDRQRLVDMWRRHGIVCCQVAPGDFDTPRAAKPGKLIVLVGPSGAGKSSYARSTFPKSAIVSSDDLRVELCGDRRAQHRNTDVFRALHEIVRTRLRCGLDTVVDATNIKSADRRAVVACAPAGAEIEYHVIDRPMPDKARDAGWRAEVLIKDQPLISYHAQTFGSNLPAILAGDGDARVKVVDRRVA